MWTADEKSRLASLTISPSIHSKAELKVLVLHFLAGGTIYRPLKKGLLVDRRWTRKSQNFLRKLKKAVDAGKLDWILVEEKRAEPTQTLNPTEAGRLLKLQQDVEFLRHQEEIRDRIRSLPGYLRFWPLDWVQILDLSIGVSSTGGFGSTPDLLWTPDQSGLVLRNLDKAFAHVIEHLRSAGENGFIQSLGQWRVLGGRCIEQCHRFEQDVVQQAESETGLKTEVYNGAPDHRVLSGGFSRTIYLKAVGRRDIALDYMVGSRTTSLILLALRGGTSLAWVASEDEFDRLRAIHLSLIERTSSSLLLTKLQRLVKEMAVVDEELSRALSDFAGRQLISGQCSQCRDL